eukprot:759433-Hanusia_phi.AAC.4
MSRERMKSEESEVFVSACKRANAWASTVPGVVMSSLTELFPHDSDSPVTRVPPPPPLPASRTPTSRYLASSDHLGVLHRTIR